MMSHHVSPCFTMSHGISENLRLKIQIVLICLNIHMLRYIEQMVWCHWYLAKSLFLVGMLGAYLMRPTGNVLRVLNLTCQASARVRFTESNRLTSTKRPARQWTSSCSSKRMALLLLYAVSRRSMRMSCINAWSCMILHEFFHETRENSGVLGCFLSTGAIRVRKHNKIETWINLMGGWRVSILGDWADWRLRVSKHTQSSCCTRRRSAIWNVVGAADEMGTHDLCDVNYLHVLSKELHIVVPPSSTALLLGFCAEEATELS